MTEQYSGETLKDYITGNIVANIGAEINRQQVEKILVEQKGYAPKDIQVDGLRAIRFKAGPRRKRARMALHGDQMRAGLDSIA